MALATQEDVEERLGRRATEAEAARLPSLLSDASAVVIGYCRQGFEPKPYPEAVVGVVAKMVARSLGRATIVGGEYVDQQSAGPFAVRYTSASSEADVWVTAADKLALRPYRKGGGLIGVQMVGERYGISDSGEDV